MSKSFWSFFSFIYYSILFYNIETNNYGFEYLNF